MKKKHSKGAFGRSRFQSQITPPVTTLTVEIPYDIKVDIAKVVRSVDWDPAGKIEGGLCFYRAVTGCTVLQLLEFKSIQPTMGGMVYRAGPDERRDVVGFCGPGNQGCSIKGHFLGHYWIVDDNNFIDFSVGDWKQTIEMTGKEWHQAMERDLSGESLDPIQWTAPELPDFFWTHKDNLTVSWEVNRKQHTPALGRAWYAGFHGDSETSKQFTDTIRSTVPFLKEIVPHLREAIKFYALKERLFALRERHTAVRFSELAKLTGDQGLIDQAKEDERLIVLRGKQEITREAAREILSEAGIKNDLLRRDPGHAIAIKKTELYALANYPLAADDPYGEELYYVPRIPSDAAEADAMLEMTTVVSDLTDPQAVLDPKSTIKICAGYTDEELMGGNPALRIR